MLKIFEIFRVVSLFDYQGSCLLFVCISQRQLIHNTTSFIVCQQLFKTFLEVFSMCFAVINHQRRRRDLNPRAAINDLHPFQGCPFSLLGTSAKKQSLLAYLILMCRFTLLKPLAQVVLISGEDGIRTHAPVKTNGFQDRPVMTASVPLQLFALFSARFILSLFLFNVNTFF